MKTATTDKSIFSRMESLLKLDKLFEGGIPIKYLPKVLFLVLVAVFYIGNNHYSDRTIRQIDYLKNDVEDLRADYITLKAEYMYASKQSEVARKTAKLGLIESAVPPFKIVLEKD